ncbi:hypothetical protein GCM10020218_028920 [Dactylosporangium vinaceum]
MPLLQGELADHGGHAEALRLAGAVVGGVRVVAGLADGQLQRPAVDAAVGVDPGQAGVRAVDELRGGARAGLVVDQHHLHRVAGGGRATAARVGRR